MNCVIEKLRFCLCGVATGKIFKNFGNFFRIPIDSSCKIEKIVYSITLMNVNCFFHVGFIGSITMNSLAKVRHKDL